MKILIGGKNECLWVLFDYDIELVNRIKSVGYRNSEKCLWNPSLKKWKVPVTLFQELLKAFPNADVTPNAYDFFEDLPRWIAAATKMWNSFQSLALRLAYLQEKHSEMYFMDIPSDVRKETQLLRDKCEEIAKRMYWTSSDFVAYLNKLRASIDGSIIKGIHLVDVTTEEYAHEKTEIELRGYIGKRLVKIQLEEPDEREKDGDEALLGCAGYRLYQAEDDKQYWTIPIEDRAYAGLIWW